MSKKGGEGARLKRMSLRTLWGGLARMEVLVAYRAWQVALDILEDDDVSRVNTLLARGSQLIDEARCVASLIHDGIPQTASGLRASPKHPAIVEASERASALRALVDDVWTVACRVSREISLLKESEPRQRIEAIRDASQRHLALLRGACIKWIRFHGRRERASLGNATVGQAPLAYACLHRLRAVVYCHEALGALLQMADEALDVVHHPIVQKPDSGVQVSLEKEDGEAEDDAAMKLSQL